MKKLQTLFKGFSSLAMLLLLAVACVDEKYDLSKDIDMTVGVGEGLSLPVGSTEKIMLTELIDTADTDVVKIDSEGNYSIFKSGEFTPESFRIDELDVTIEPTGEKKHYDFALVEITEDLDKLPTWMQQEILNQKFPYQAHQNIDYTTKFDVEQVVPSEMKRLRSLTFSNDAKMSITVKIFSADHQSDDMLEIVNQLHLNSVGNEGFLIDVPEYIVFADKSITGGHLHLRGAATYNSSIKALEYKCEYGLDGLDFSNYKDGYLPVMDSKISIHDTLGAVGFVESDTVFFAYKNLSHIQSVDVEVNFAIDKMQIKSVEGIFAPDIEPIEESVYINLGDDLDFLNDAYLDFNDPRIFVTFGNPVDAKLFAAAEFVGYDKDGNEIDGSSVEAEMVLEGATTNRIFINRYATEMPGYTTVLVPDLNDLVKTIPDRIAVNVNAEMDEAEYSTVELGKDFCISGNYQVSVPLVFDEFSLVYTETLEDVLGDNADDITDYVTDIESVTVAFEALNTVPAEFTPSIIAYDKYGNRLSGITVKVQGVVDAGNGMDGAVVTEPVKSAVEINLSAFNGELAKLYTLDINFEGKGCGRFNANEYIQLKDITVTIDESISVDLN